MKVVWTDEAFRSLKDIYEYISRDSENFAMLQVEKILSLESQIGGFPFSGRIVPEYSDKSVREILSGNYRIIYRIAENDLIEVTTVVHVARDLKNLQ